MCALLMGLLGCPSTAPWNASSGLNYTRFRIADIMASGGTAPGGCPYDGVFLAEAQENDIAFTEWQARLALPGTEQYGVAAGRYVKVKLTEDLFDIPRTDRPEVGDELVVSTRGWVEESCEGRGRGLGPGDKLIVLMKYEGVDDGTPRPGDPRGRPTRRGYAVTKFLCLENDQVVLADRSGTLKLVETARVSMDQFKTLVFHTRCSPNTDAEERARRLCRDVTCPEGLTCFFGNGCVEVHQSEPADTRTARPDGTDGQLPPGPIENVPDAGQR
jgi:hypothetical protein